MPRKLKRNLFIFAAIFLIFTLAWQIGRTFFQEEEMAARSHVRAAVEQHFGDEVAEARKRFGLKLWHKEDSSKADIVLIHGLDDPGKVWMNLRERLKQDGYSVWVMTYANDQPIHDSAIDFYQALSRLDLNAVSIVAHSMGGLVSRDMLTYPEMDQAQIPQVDHLIMVGTPNHGSELARFRAFAEWREQAQKIIDNEFHWLGWIVDGAGEAGLDLIPGSPFLTELNRRPNPKDTKMSVIAGVLSEIDRKKLSELVDNPAIRESIEKSTDLYNGLNEEIGDGLVTLESTKLAGARFYKVNGTHLSIIRNILASSQNTPPAIPIITQILQEEYPSSNIATKQH